MTNFCADYSRAAQEPLFGTAKRVDWWVLIEYRGRWEHEAFESLPAGAQNWVEQWKRRLPHMRLGLIRQGGQSSRPLAGFLAQSREAESRLFSFSFDTHADLEHLDLEKIMASSPQRRPILLVCTHGTHDRCCAKFGNALFDAMRRAAGGDAWQVSHIGGCRFAPNVITLPEGVVYGHARPGDCEKIVDAARTGRLVTSLLRGRSCYDKPVQAAEYFLRTAFPDAGEAKLLSTEEANGEWTVIFGFGDARYAIQLALEESGISTFQSCASIDPRARETFRFIHTQSGGFHHGVRNTAAEPK